MTAARAAVAAALTGMLCGESLACGACIEDKVAATYDHEVIRHATARGEVMVFCEVGGPVFDAARLKAAVRGVRGVRSSSVRVSAQPAALSFAVQPTLASPRAAVERMQRAAPPGTRLTIVRVLATKPPVARVSARPKEITHAQSREAHEGHHHSGPALP